MAESADLVKVTIRLPRELVKMAKLHALALDDDLQDFVARVLWEAVREPLPASLPLVLARGPRKKDRRAKVRTFTPRPDKGDK